MYPQGTPSLHPVILLVRTTCVWFCHLLTELVHTSLPLEPTIEYYISICEHYMWSLATIDAALSKGVTAPAFNIIECLCNKAQVLDEQ